MRIKTSSLAGIIYEYEKLKGIPNMLIAKSQVHRLGIITILPDRYLVII
jgi:hypothetical protein